MHYKETPFGFEWGNAKMIRHFQDEKRGWVYLGIETSKYRGHKRLSIYVTKTGKIRIFSDQQEWFPKEAS
jgi:hypothetical protein